MITGDHVVTASAIAKELGILTNPAEALSGSELQALSDDELDERVKDLSVYARVTPEDKIRIVKSWQRTGAVVAMTGDGVNDAPALKASDVGCAMGITGTDVAQSASDMILTDDNFATIVDAVSQGRSVYQNIRKAINFLLSCNVSEIFIVLIAMLVGWEHRLQQFNCCLSTWLLMGCLDLLWGVNQQKKGSWTKHRFLRMKDFCSRITTKNCDQCDYIYDRNFVWLLFGKLCRYH